MIFLDTLVVDMFVDVVYVLVYTGHAEIIAMINKQVVVVTYMTRAAIISSACIVTYSSTKFLLKFPATSRSSPWGRLLMAAKTSSMVEASLGANVIPPLPPFPHMVRIVYDPNQIVRTASCLSPFPSP